MNGLFVEQLTVIDCAYLDAQRGLVGESYLVDVELCGELDEQSMVLDFGAVKKELKRVIDAGVDHTLLVPMLAPELICSPEEGEVVQLVFRSSFGPIEYCSPAGAVTRLPVAEVSPQALADLLEVRLAAAVPVNVAEVRVHLRTESADGAWYHYVHGLKKHAGACQRIAHGHRSRLQIFVDGARDADLEREWALSWSDIYLGSREDVVAQDAGRILFAYAAREGRFELGLPVRRVELLDSDTTVECIAEFLARAIASRRPGCEIVVRAYEGPNKGAVYRVRFPVPATA